MSFEKERKGKTHGFVDLLSKKKLLVHYFLETHKHELKHECFQKNLVSTDTVVNIHAINGICTI